jgi:hypothetical protein
MLMDGIWGLHFRWAFGFAFFLPFLLPIPNCPSSQLINDILEYESTSTPGSADLTLDKPGGADLQLDLATGPALYAWEEFPEMGELIGRKFEGPGDVEMVCFVCFLFLPSPASSLRFSFTMNRLLNPRSLSLLHPPSLTSTPPLPRPCPELTPTPCRPAP